MYVFLWRVCLVIVNLMLLEVLVRNMCFFFKLVMNGFFVYDNVKNDNIVFMLMVIYV